MAKKRAAKATPAKKRKTAAAAEPAPAAAGMPAPAAAALPDVADVDAIEIDLESDDGVPTAQASRRAPRVAMNERVEISGFYGGGSHEDKLVDASLDGLFVETARPLDVGDPVVLLLPIDDGKRLRVSGRVRWVTPFGGLKDARPGMGIQLVGLTKDARASLQEMLHRRAR